MSTRIFEKVVDENLSALLKITTNHGFYGAEEVQNYVKERRKEKDGIGEGKKTMQTFVFILILATLTIRATLSKKHD